MANCEAGDALDTMQEELIDRFGPLPESAQALVASHRLRIAAKALGIVRIDAAAGAVMLHFDANPSVDPTRIIALVQKHRHWKLAGPTKLRIEVKGATWAERVQATGAILKELKPGK
jgi:transcription-repair coupling factor (superfamily II helicase)